MSEQWKYNDEITLTFGGLKESQNEAYLEGIEIALREVRRIYKTDEAFNKLVHELRQTRLYDVPAKEEE
jgi:hypothetical protein